MAQPLRKDDRHYTIDDLYTWDDDTLWELIDGIAYAMSTPLIVHQRISAKLFMQLATFLHGKSCEVFPTPTGVKLCDDADNNTFVIPDIIVVCDPDKIERKYINGAPDLVIEILSPSTQRHDTLAKFRLYQNAKVPEFWTVDPETGVTRVHILENGKYFLNAYSDEDTAPVHVLPGCTINFADVFADAKPLAGENYAK